MAFPPKSKPPPPPPPAAIEIPKKVRPPRPPDSAIGVEYRACCMFLILCRFVYYVLGSHLMSDADYDEAEDIVRAFEERHPDLKHPRSPTAIPGSDSESSYPESIRRFCSNCADGCRPEVDIHAWSERFARVSLL